MEKSELQAGVNVTLPNDVKAVIHAVNTDLSVLVSVGGEVLARHYQADQLTLVPAEGAAEPKVEQDALLRDESEKQHTLGNRRTR